MNKYIITMIVLFAIINKAHSQCACCSGASIGSSTGDYNNGMLVLQKKQFIIEGYADYRKFTNEGGHHSEPADTTAEEETPLKSMLINSIGLRYGITDRVTISALLPYVFLNTHIGNDNGLGDLILLGTFNIANKNKFNLALQAGVELPIGQQKKSSFDNTTIVVGSGSLDPMAGIIASKNWGYWKLQASLLYKHTTQGFNKFNYGSVSNHTIGIAYQATGQNAFCSPDSLAKSDKINLGITAGYYGEWVGQIVEDEIADENSGYYLGFGTLGTNLFIKSWCFPLSFSYPILQHLNGDQSNTSIRLRIGIIKLL